MGSGALLEIEDVDGNKTKTHERIDHEPFLVIGCYCNYAKGVERWHEGDSLEAFWAWVIGRVGKKERLFMFAHNVTYDFISSKGFDLLKSHGYEIDNFYEKGRTFILTFKHYDHTRLTKDGKPTVDRTITILNTGNFYDGSVAKLGKAFGLPKLEMDYQNPTWEEALPYCRRDVEIIKRAMEGWFDYIRQEKLGNFAATAPGQAMNAYRHRFMSEPILIHDHPGACGLERDAYYGGRVECHFVGKVPQPGLYYLDVNSMYPYVMSAFEYPVALQRYRKDDRLNTTYLKNMINKGFLVIAEVDVVTDTPIYPKREGLSIIFPVGEFRTFLSTPEIERGLKHGYIKKVYKVAVYAKAKIFDRFIDFFYTSRLAAKAAGDEVRQLLAKLLMNSLYGKFGQKGGGWALIGETDKPGAGADHLYNADSDREYYERWINGKLFREQEEEEGFNSFTAIAAHVTANARLVLYDAFVVAGHGDVFYNDTDSMIVSPDGYARMVEAGQIDQKRLGAFKIESELAALTLYSPKDYHPIKKDGTGKPVHKGIPHSKEMAIKTGPATWRVLHWPHIGTLIQQNSLTHYYNEWRTKKLARIYTKGYVLDNGQVLPLRFIANQLEYPSWAVNRIDLINKYGEENADGDQRNN